MYKLVKPSKIPEAHNLDLGQVTYGELKKIGQGLADLCFLENFLGLAAVQVGLPIRFHIITMPDSWIGYINSEYDPIYKESQPKTFIEPFPNERKKYKVRRWDKIEVGGYLYVHIEKPLLKTFSMQVDGIRSVLHQHLIDMTNGIYPSVLGEKV